MHVTLKHHRRVILIFGSITAVLIAALVAILLIYVLPTEEKRPLSGGPIDDAASVFWEAPKSPFAAKEEVVIVHPQPNDAATTSAEEVLPVTEVLFEYIRIMDSCGARFEGECVNVRSGPGTDHPVVTRLRNDIILKVDGKVERGDHSWFRIVFDEWLRYPERAEGDWYVAADFVEVLLDEGVRTTWEHGNATTSKRIVVDRSEQMLYAYESDKLFMETSISTGLELSPTPRGTFTVFKKTPSRYMQGPIPGIPGSDYYDLPGVPWNLYFTEGGAVIHGAYWHENFGEQYSHGCVNLRPMDAERLYNWAPLGTTVVVRD
ncbi:MAG: L,D-transpeptidase family protein [Candidatus Paceibacterota bacterium]